LVGEGIREIGVFKKHRKRETPKGGREKLKGGKKHTMKANGTR